MAGGGTGRGLQRIVIRWEASVMANIMILNGASRKNGRTASLVKAFTDGAESAGKEKEAKRLGESIR